MDGETGGRLLNTNPSRFEELAGVIATAYAYLDEGRAMHKLLDDFQHLYRRALDQPPCYNEINEITGQSLTSGYRMAGQTAWMLQKMEGLRVYGVHSMLWHEVDKVYSAPLIDQMGLALGIPSRLTQEDLKRMADDKKALVITRDKIRHDLGERLVGNGFMRKLGSEFSLTMKGIARYLYCLAKYTTKAKADAEDVIEACKKQRERILEHYHCI